MSVESRGVCYTAATVATLKDAICPVVWDGPVIDQESSEDCQFYEEVVVPQLIAQVLKHEGRENWTLYDVDNVRFLVENDIIQATIWESQRCDQVEQLCAARGFTGKRQVIEISGTCRDCAGASH